jgi:poly-gamma-glutamate capsule biosynthesis protein CapA/YwtB (metallophosphatase superfamily)
MNDRVPIDEPMLARGVAIDFGRHICALWEDREPRGLLDENDLVAHHLGGLPEIVPLRELARERGPFAVRVPRRGPLCRLALAGDVVMAGDGGTGLTALAKQTAGADLTIVNLEGIPSNNSPAHPPRYDFRFDPARVADLRRARIGVVSLANNHAADAGPAGIVAGRMTLEQAGIGVIGAGRDLTEALQPWRSEVSGVRLAVFGVCAVAAPAATADQPGVAALPQHAKLLESEFAAARARGEVMVAVVHWGDEFTPRVNDEQRQWGRWLAERGVAVVAGSGPHMVQRCDRHAGALLAYSLGNAVYPDALKGAGGGIVWKLRMGAGEVAAE